AFRITFPEVRGENDAVRQQSVSEPRKEDHEKQKAKARNRISAQPVSKARSVVRYIEDELDECSRQPHLRPSHPPSRDYWAALAESGQERRGWPGQAGP